MSDHELHLLHKLAVAEYQDDDIRIDVLRQSDVAPAEGGTWVRAWVWVANNERNSDADQNNIVRDSV